MYRFIHCGRVNEVRMDSYIANDLEYAVKLVIKKVNPDGTETPHRTAFVSPNGILRGPADPTTRIYITTTNDEPLCMMWAKPGVHSIKSVCALPTQ